LNQKKILRWVAAASILSVGVLILAYTLSHSSGVDRDFISYWAAGKQLIHHGNPYDGRAILALQRGAGSTESAPFFMRNPPIAFFITIPIALVSARVGVVLWSLAIIAALMLSIRLTWRLNGHPKDSLHLFGYVFPPALACLLAGQIGIFILLGVVLFLTLRERRPFLAGMSLLLCALKPHLFIPFATVVLLWTLYNRTYRILTGAAVAIAGSLALGYFLDPRGWSDYAQMVRTSQLETEFIPTISLLFRLAVHPQWIWLQIVPALIGARWALRYFWSNRAAWDWMDHGMLLLIVSIMVAPYAWFTDEAVLLPAILVSLYRASEARRSLIPYGCIAGAALIEVFAGAGINTGYYLWTTPAWLGWYLYATADPSRRERDIATLPEP
jgi:hypothetical protein